MSFSTATPFRMELEEISSCRNSLSKKGISNKAFENPDHFELDVECIQGAIEADITGEQAQHNKSCFEEKYNELKKHYENHKALIKQVIYCALLLGYISLVIVACIINFERALSLLLLTIVGIVFISWDKLISKYEDRITQIFHPYKRRLEQQEHWLKWVLYIALIAAVICWLVFDTANQGTRQLISFGGLLMYIALMFIFSKHPTKISWRTVFSGVGLQFVFGVFILRTQIGYDAFAWSGKQMETFLQYSNVGSEFVFGEKYTDHFFAFKVLPIVVFFSMITSILYYIGFMQWIILKVGWIMQLVMATSPTESVVAAGNIFIGQSEAPLIIRPYLQQLTKSEIHAVMTGGFATIAGSVLGAYIQAGVPASHLLTASVMSAPASLAVAKLCWPETDTPKITRKGFKMEKREEKNILEAASHGASLSIPLVANIAVNLIAFLSLLAFLNSALSWLGNMFDYPQFSFSVICSYIFMPFSFMMGVDWNDSFLVGELIGYKTFFNEFVAYNKLAEMIKKRQAGGPEYSGEIKQYLSAQSEVIATYALCGFANFGSLGVQIGALSSLAPKRRSDISSCALRSLISGTIACFMTACVAGMLYIPEEALTCPFVLDNTFNSNLSSIINTTDLAKCCTVLFERFGPQICVVASNLFTCMTTQVEVNPGQLTAGVPRVAQVPSKFFFMITGFMWPFANKLPLNK